VATEKEGYLGSERQAHGEGLSWWGKTEFTSAAPRSSQRKEKGGLADTLGHPRSKEERSAGS